MFVDQSNISTYPGMTNWVNESDEPKLHDQPKYIVVTRWNSVWWVALVTYVFVCSFRTSIIAKHTWNYLGVVNIFISSIAFCHFVNGSSSPGFRVRRMQFTWAHDDKYKRASLNNVSFLPRTCPCTRCFKTFVTATMNSWVNTFIMTSTWDEKHFPGRTHVWFFKDV